MNSPYLSVMVSPGSLLSGTNATPVRDTAKRPRHLPIRWRWTTSRDVSTPAEALAADTGGVDGAAGGVVFGVEATAAAAGGTTTVGRASAVATGAVAAGVAGA